MARHLLQLKDIKNETLTTKSLIFTVAEKFSFSAGQYLNITIPELTSHSKAYTIASTPSCQEIILTIKKQGNFSSALLALEVGQQVFADGPEGYFFENFSSQKPTVFIAGGIGITPFISLIRDQLNSDISLNNLIIAYSNKTKGDIVFYEELKKIQAEKKLEKVLNFLTQESRNGFDHGRINADILKKRVPDFKVRDYYLCGSISFVNSMWKMVGGLGVSEESIFTEAFF